MQGALILVCETHLERLKLAQMRANQRRVVSAAKRVARENRCGYDADLWGPRPSRWFSRSRVGVSNPLCLTGPLAAPHMAATLMVYHCVIDTIIHPTSRVGDICGPPPGEP
jgi:hypothetical protein